MKKVVCNTIKFRIFALTINQIINIIRRTHAGPWRERGGQRKEKGTLYEQNK